MPEISVLVPVYNAEKFLSACIDSVLAQTFTDFELLCADDASTDGSLQILKQYAQKDKRVRILPQKSNDGAAQNRNALLQNATGKYLAFVDADDSIEPTYLEHLHAQAVKHQADIVRCLFISENITTGETFHCEERFKEFLRAAPGPAPLARLQAAIDDTQVWLKLIKTSLVKDNQLTFRPHSRAEDFPFEVLLYQYAGKIVFTSQHLYRYRVGNNQSLSANKMKEAYGVLENMICLCQDLARRGLTEPVFYGKMLDLILDGVKRMRKFSFPESYQSGKLCRKAFQTVEENLAYCRCAKKIRLRLICLLAKGVKDDLLPYYASYFVYWSK